MPQLQIAQDPAADALLSADPFALLTGMLLDQQFPMERAFAGPEKIRQRFGNLDPGAIAAADPEAFADLCATPPAVHRYGRAMAGRIQQLAAVVVGEYGGNAARIWLEAVDGADLKRRRWLFHANRQRVLLGLCAANGVYGDQKARILIALLAKQLEVRPQGWEQAAGAYAETGSFRSVADVVDEVSLHKVRDFKKQAKAAAKAASA